MSVKTCALFVLVVSCVVVAASATPEGGIEHDVHFEAFMDFTHQFGKKYNTVEEFLVRMENFKASMRRVARLQAEAGNITQYGVTQFSDMTPEEFTSRMLNPEMPRFVEEALAAGDIPVISHHHHNLAAPTSFDWRNTPGVIGAVKNQGGCGSCWAFAATEQLESMWFRRMAPASPVVLSPQHLVSCSTTNSGCNGGMADRAFAWIQKNGIALESTYPYTSGTTKVSGTCMSVTKSTVSVWSGGTPYAFVQSPCYTDCPSVDITPMKNYVATQGPVQVNVCADSFQDYISGVMERTTCASSMSKMNHAVQLVGYNAAVSPPYWIVRNSWSASWANRGYVYISMNNNACGVSNYPVTVFIKGQNN